MGQQEEDLADLLGDLEEGDSKEELSDHSKRVFQASTVVPMYDANTRSSNKRAPGRPKGIAPKPTRDDLYYHREVLQQQATWVDQDEVVRATRKRQSSLEMLQILKERLAIAGANLDFHRVELQKRGANRDVASVITRQIQAIEKLAHIELEINKFQGTVFNLRDERLQKIFSMLIDSFRDAAAEMLPPEQFDLLWNRVETKMEGWEEKAESLVR
jgi:hypothetical protein